MLNAKKSTIVFVPGLQGSKGLQQKNGLDGTNEEVVREVAKDCGWNFFKAVYQTKENPNPLLSEMQREVAVQLSRICTKVPPRPVLVCGSSVGFGVAVGALARLYYETSKIALLGYKPVPDPLHAIGQQIGEDVLFSLKSGALAEIEMPVKTENGSQEDFFLLSGRHIADKFATRVFENPIDRDPFRSGFNTASGLNPSLTANIEAATLIYGNNDSLTPFSDMLSFKSIVRSCETKLVGIQGDHVSDARPFLRKELYNIIARLG